MKNVSDTVLFHREYGEGRPIIVLHGLFGSSDNWVTPIKLFTNFKAYLIDQRNHGQSFHDNSHNYDNMADDLMRWIDANKPSEVNLLGHSMGGKTVLRFLQKYRDVAKTAIIADMGVKQYPAHHVEIIKGLQAVMPHQITSRAEAEQRMAQFIGVPAIRQFLLKNLYRIDEGFAWRFNLDVLAENISEVYKPTPIELPVLTPTIFIYGGTSKYIVPDDYKEIKALFANAEFAAMPNTGHWLHAENPQLFADLSLDFLNKNK